MKKIEKFMWESKDSFNLDSYYKTEESMYRFVVYANYYAFQSYAKAYVFTDSGWVVLCSIPYTKMASAGTHEDIKKHMTPDKRDKYDFIAMEQDESVLIELAIELVYSPL